MRWLAILAIIVAGAAGYLAWSLSSGTSPARASRQVETEDKVEEPTPAKPTAGDTPTVRRPEPPPVVVAKKESPPPRSSPSFDRPATTPPPAQPDASEEEVPWTEEQRKQQLFTAHGRYEKGNYPGAVEAAMELARRYPPWAEDGYKVAIMAHCAMNELDKANALYQQMTDKPAIDELTKACTGWGMTLTKK